MKNFLIAFFVFLLWSIFGMWYYSCIVKELCSNTALEQNVISETEVETSTEKESDDTTKEPNNPFDVTDENGNLIFKFPDNLGITANNFNVNFPKGNSEFMDSVFKFLNKNQNKELLITGLFNSDESKDNGSLGLNRANFIKDMLVKFGVNTDRISVSNQLKDFSFDTNGNFSGGVLFEFLNLSEEKLKEIESGIANKTLYSGFGSKEFAPDNTLQAYALELKNYLNKYPNKSANIVGHTDSVGDLEANDWYGMERAKNVKLYLVSQGISENRLVASSKGETEPIDSNGTLEGRRKNRRIEIKVN